MRDEAHPVGARLTLERETFPAPFTVTCSIYGWLAHTCHYASEAEAQAAFDAMKPEVARILLLISGAQDEGEDSGFLAVRRALEGFLERFPRVG